MKQLAARSYLNLIKKAQLINYEVVLLFFYLPSAKMAKGRVALRVSKGGHNIPIEVVERRYQSGLENLKKFIEIVDVWAIYDNSKSPSQVITKGEHHRKIKIINFEIWETLKMI